MNSNEDKLRRVLFEESATVVPSADAWPKIREGVDRRRRWRQWLQYGGATAGATAAIVAGVVLANSEGLGQREAALVEREAIAEDLARNVERCLRCLLYLPQHKLQPLLMVAQELVHTAAQVVEEWAVPREYEARR